MYNEGVKLIITESCNNKFESCVPRDDYHCVTMHITASSEKSLELVQALRQSTGPEVTTMRHITLEPLRITQIADAVSEFMT